MDDCQHPKLWEKDEVGKRGAIDSMIPEEQSSRKVSRSSCVFKKWTRLLPSIGGLILSSWRENTRFSNFSAASVCVVEV